MSKLTLLDTLKPIFPNPDEALTTPNGLLAVGGNLSKETLLAAYRSGIFPWYERGQPLLWWSPDPRAVIFPENILISRSLKKSLRSKPWEIKINGCFSAILQHCAAPRHNLSDTWITDEMKTAYLSLHAAGSAHSLEVWLDGELAGGLYGLLIGNIFCGESMFSLQRDASKIALVQLVAILKQYTNGGFIDCQVPNNHLLSMGATTIPRGEFIARLLKSRNKVCHWPDKWSCKSEGLVV